MTWEFELVTVNSTQDQKTGAEPTTHHCLKYSQKKIILWNKKQVSLAHRHGSFHIFSTEQTKDALEQLWHQ